MKKNSRESVAEPRRLVEKARKEFFRNSILMTSASIGVAVLALLRGDSAACKALAAAALTLAALSPIIAFYYSYRKYLRHLKHR